MRTTLQNHKMTSTIMALRGERWSYIIALAAVFLLLILVFLSAVTNFYTVGKLMVTTQEEITSIAKLHNGAKLNLDDAKKTDISHLQLFGRPPAAIEASTNSNYTILGIEYSPAYPENAKVILNSGDEDGIYKVGDKLGTGIVIDTITPNSVILMQNGVKQKLTLNWEGDSLISHDHPAPVNLGIIPQNNSQINPSLPTNMLPNNMIYNLEKLKQENTYLQQ